jgi:hypothetical protein
MGNKINKNAAELTENDIQLLMCNTSFDREQIQDWHRGFLVNILFLLYSKIFKLIF